jgi:Transposase and inactivated derivatives
MQGKKDIFPKLFYSLSLDTLVPQDDFYRKLNKSIDLRFLYQQTQSYYGSEGQSSIDPVVFFKICMIGYLNNIVSDRTLIRFCADSLSLRLYLGYDLDEELPWHSTISRTRKLFGEEVFLSLFQEVLRLCCEKGMVSGKRQAVDSAFVKANASMDSLLEKEVLDDVEKYAEELEGNSEFKVSSAKKKQVEQHHKWKEKNYETMPGTAYKGGKTDENGNEFRSKYLSNHTHYSPTDPDARISTKPGKPRNLNFFGQVGVDTKKHVITGATADFADKRDSQCLEKITEQMLENLQQNHINMDELLADTGYSSGEALKYLEEKKINGYIPNFGQYKPERDGFIFNQEKNQYECLQGNRAVLPYKNTRLDRGYNKMIYRSSEKDCKSCPLRTACCGEKSKFKKISHSEFYQEYQRQHDKLKKNEKYAKRMSRLRSSTVEPVLGTLLNFMGMKKIYARGIEQAEKHVLMASLCYNLKKMLKWQTKKVQIQVSYVPITDKKQEVLDFLFFAFTRLFFIRFKPL